MRERSPAAVGDATGRRVLEVLCSAALAIRLANLNQPGRYALGMVLDPGFLHEETRDSRAHPYGVLYFFGRMFHGFHVRFRSIARGGLQWFGHTSAWRTSMKDRLYNEAWALAMLSNSRTRTFQRGRRRDSGHP